MISPLTPRCFQHLWISLAQALGVWKRWWWYYCNSILEAIWDIFQARAPYLISPTTFQSVPAVRYLPSQRQPQSDSLINFTTDSRSQKLKIIWSSLSLEFRLLIIRWIITIQWLAIFSLKPSNQDQNCPNLISLFIDQIHVTGLSHWQFWSAAGRKLIFCLLTGISLKPSPGSVSV